MYLTMYPVSTGGSERSWEGQADETSLAVSVLFCRLVKCVQQACAVLLTEREGAAPSEILPTQY